MLTDRPPLKAAALAGFVESDRLGSLAVPPDDRLRRHGESIESAMKGGTNAVVRHACAEFLNAASDFYSVQMPGIRVLAARPLRVREGGWATELFGDYAPETMLIRVWMRTAVRKQVTSFGTFLSTLCHEFCHHLDYQRFAFVQASNLCDGRIRLPISVDDRSPLVTKLLDELLHIFLQEGQQGFAIR